MSTETVEGIATALGGVASEDKHEAINFLREYARENLYFNGGEVLSAWRKTNNSVAQKRWRNKWGAIISLALHMGILRKVGRTKPNNKQSHTISLVLWQSRVYKGREKKKEEPDSVYITNLFTDVSFGKIKLKDALTKAYEFGFESGVMFDYGVGD